MDVEAKKPARDRAVVARRREFRALKTRIKTLRAELSTALAERRKYKSEAAATAPEPAKAVE